MILKDCTGFCPQAKRQWDSLRYGFEHLPVAVTGTNQRHCYFCFSSLCNSDDLSVRSIRVRQTLGEDVVLSPSVTGYFVVFMDASVSQEFPVVLDIIRGVAFCDTKSILVIPPISDPVVAIRDVLDSLLSTTVQPEKVLDYFYGSTAHAIEVYQSVVGLLYVRDLLRFIKSDGRRPHPEIQALLSTYSTKRPSWKNFLNATVMSLEEFNEVISSVKPTIDVSARGDFDAAVVAAYNRKPPPTKRAAAAPTQDGSKRSLRNKKRTTKYQDSEDDEVMENVPVAPTLVVENWLQCDNCSKWRLVTESQQAEFEDKFFQCSEVGKSCDTDPSDELARKV